MTSGSWKDYCDANLLKANRNASEVQRSYSVVDDDIKVTIAPDSTMENWIALCDQLPFSSRRGVRDAAILRGLRRGLTPLLEAEGAVDANSLRKLVDEVDAALCAPSIRPVRDDANDIFESAIDGIGAAVSSYATRGRLFEQLYAALELVHVSNDDDASAVAFALWRAAQLETMLPKRRVKRGRSAGGAAGSIGVPTALSTPDAKSKSELVEEVGIEIANAFSSATMPGWSALAGLAQEQDVYFGKIPARKINNAIRFLDVDEENVLGLIDLTVFGSARCCLCFLKNEIRVRNDWGAKTPGVFTIPFARFADAQIGGTYEILLLPDDAAVSMAGSSLKREKLVTVLRTISRVTSLTTS